MSSKVERTVVIFTFILIDKPESAELRLRVRPEHKAYLTAVADHIAFAGPFTGDDGITICAVDAFNAGTEFVNPSPYLFCLKFLCNRPSTRSRKLFYGCWGGRLRQRCAPCCVEGRQLHEGVQSKSWLDQHRHRAS